MIKPVKLRQFFVGPLKYAIWGCLFLISLSILVYWTASFATRKDAEERLVKEFTNIQNHINTRMQVYTNEMLATRAFIYNHKNINQTSFNDFIQDTHIFKQYEDIQAMGYTDYRESDFYAPVVSIYPENSQNLAFLGFNMLSEAPRKNAILQSIIYDKPILAGPLTLLQDRNIKNHPPVGFVLYLPVYKSRGPKVIHDRNNTKGLIFISMRAVDFFSAVFEKQSLTNEKVGFSIESVSTLKEKMKLYDRFGDRSRKIELAKTFDFFGEKLCISIYPLENFYSKYDNIFPYILSLLSLLLCALIFVTLRKNATYAAELGKTNDLLNHTLGKQKEKQDDLILLLKKVEDANRSKSAFLANMSHEIRTPLNALMGFSEILVRNDVTPKMKNDLSINIIKNGKQLSLLVDDILDLSKIEAGKSLIEKNRINLFDLLGEIQSIMKMRIINHRIDFKISLEGRVPQFIHTDTIRLKQILTNLIGNAIKFTDHGLVQLKISYQKDKTVMIFKVEDTGRGIDNDFKPHLFLPFSQGDVTSTRKYGGTGLGLAISKRLAFELGGNLILVSSEKGIGSVFELTIPIEELPNQIWTNILSLSEKEDEIHQATFNNQLKQKKILLVEDSVDNQDFFNFFLSRAGGEVKLVNNGLDAVDEATNITYDIILMDIQMPGIDGKEAARRIRQNGFKGLIVALTAHAMEEEQMSCLAAGCDGQISKPVSGEELILQVSNFIKAGHATTS